MRVNIFQHDSTESIIATVRNFYGLYDGQCVSFEDKSHNTIIARYENFEDGMTVLVKATGEECEPADGPAPRQSLSPRRPRLGPPFQMLPPQAGHANISRPSSRNARRRSKSPASSRGGRSTSANTNPKSRSRPTLKGRSTGSHGSLGDGHGDAAQDYSDSDGENGSVTSSRRGKSEIVASADISVENIVEGGRRKRAKFDSSELPLFVPTQVPVTASVSSVSPQRRIGSHNGASPFAYSNQQTFSYQQPLPSPQSYNLSDLSYMHGADKGVPTGGSNYRLRDRGASQYGATRYGHNAANGVLPTPDPTIGGSVISDEDVARQLMRLADDSNFSSHGRTSTSTVDDALSGKAEAASSAADSDMSDDEGNALPAAAAVYPREGAEGGETSGEEYEDAKDGSFKGFSDEMDPENASSMQQPGNSNSNVLHGKASFSGPSAKGPRIGKSRSQSAPKNKNGKALSASKAPISPTSLPSQSRKASNASLNFQHQFGADEEDLSSKPRCQRCRKSKKGCDRQRPCQRCKDAGIGIEGCVSEDEGNGRKGRYGRHMGVPVKKDSVEDTDLHQPLQQITTTPEVFMAEVSAAADSSKKRKR
ncbi:hypothetical protein K402DRAFT_341991 [Aulographum hederae CBS 113979]|uniref:Zn(2)-C6 fungal-type domain-containing protein n=1 Tax=Aulographum hederae CBS 113979 TaxID=1176131 RepID=A0A6G1GKX9_9PEZI|nr:hypothetical protein K402DRAFT_341991 [Aulographum hederae CBS 113979]